MTIALQSIGRLLAAIVTVTLLPSAILAFGLVWYGYERSVARTERSTAAAVRALSSNVDERLLQIKIALDALVTSPALAERDWVRFHAQSLEFLRRNPIAINILVFDGSDGGQLLNTLRPPGTPLPPATGRGRREMEAFARGADWVTSDYYRGSVSSRPMIALAVPQRDNAGAANLVVAAGIDAAAFAEVIRAAHLPASWTVSVLDRSGTILARQPRRDEFVGQPATSDLRQAVALAPEGSLRTTTKDGVKVRGIYATAAQSKFVAAVGIPEEELIGSARTASVVVAAVLGCVLAVAVFVSTRLSRRIAVSLRDLASSATKVGQGHVAGAKKMVFKEAAQVQLGLNLVAAELQQAQAELEATSAELASRKAVELSGVIEAASQAMLVADGDLLVQAANSECHKLFGRPQGGLIGSSFHDLIEMEGTDRNDAGQDAIAWLPDGQRIRVHFRTSVFGVGSTRFIAATFDRREDSSAQGNASTPEGPI